MLTVLITGCGGAIGTCVVKALKMDSMDLRLIGIDADPYAACFYLKGKGSSLNKTYIVPWADHPKYISEVISICSRENVDVIFPCTDAELEVLSKYRAKLDDYGTKIVSSPIRTIRICRDKWQSYNRLNKHLPIVKSALPDNGIESAIKFTGLPATIKPRIGWGSKQTYKVNTVEEAQVMVNNVHKPVIQEWLEGEEYTVDGLTDRNGNIVCVVPRLRIKVFSGLSFQGMTVRDEKLIELGKEIAQHIKIIGPFNFQVRKSKGEAKIFEINPRFSGTGILSVKAGANIPLLAVKETCNMKIPANIDFKEGLMVSRYFEEVFFEKKR
ncbi:MAG: ATP-grasp domain-containing protein [Candidatus Jordarchaeaceae archaeon]